MTSAAPSSSGRAMRILSGKRARSSAISSWPSITCASLSTTRVAMERLLQPVRAEHLRLDPGLRHPRAEGGQVGAPPLAAAPVEVGERARAVLQPHLEVEGPERAPLVRERGADDGPAAVHRADHVLGGHAHVL